MSNIDAELARLIAPGRVHRRLYTDPAIFELEMERIFDAAWVVLHPWPDQRFGVTYSR